MKYKRACLVSGFFVITILLWLITSHFAYSAFLYKSYIVRYDRGWDILCDPYVVKKNDWVLKLFKQKGEIAHKDFPEFLRIFKRVNPHVRDINRIRPGQHILIPLKKLRQENLPEQSSGVVTIPFVTITNKHETLQSQSTKYQVQSGDCVSILVARRYGAYGTKPFKDGLKLFRRNNPRINDLDRIYVGQMIFIPELDVRNHLWDPTEFDSSDKINKKASFENVIKADEKTPESSGLKSKEDKPKPPLLEVASALDAKLFEKGDYYFPRPGAEDFKIDLAKFPIMRLKNGKRVFFFKDGSNNEPVVDVIKSFWKDVKVVRIAPNDPVEQVFEAVFDPAGKDVIKNRLSFSDNGVEVEVRGKWIFDTFSDKEKTVRHICITFIDNPGERTPQPISRYLDRNNIVIKEVLK